MILTLVWERNTRKKIRSLKNLHIGDTSNLGDLSPSVVFETFANEWFLRRHQSSRVVSSSGGVGGGTAPQRSTLQRMASNVRKSGAALKEVSFLVLFCFGLFCYGNFASQRKKNLG